MRTHSPYSTQAPVAILLLVVFLQIAFAQPACPNICRAFRPGFDTATRECSGLLNVCSVQPCNAVAPTGASVTGSQCTSATMPMPGSGIAGADNRLGACQVAGNTFMEVFQIANFNCAVLQVMPMADTCVLVIDVTACPTGAPRNVYGRSLRVTQRLPNYSATFSETSLDFFRNTVSTFTFTYASTFDPDGTGIGGTSTQDLACTLAGNTYEQSFNEQGFSCANFRHDVRSGRCIITVTVNGCDGGVPREVYDQALVVLEAFPNYDATFRRTGLQFSLTERSMLRLTFQNSFPPLAPMPTPTPMPAGPGIDGTSTRVEACMVAGSVTTTSFATQGFSCVVIEPMTRETRCALVINARGCEGGVPQSVYEIAISEVEQVSGYSGSFSLVRLFFNFADVSRVQYVFQESFP